MIHGAVRPTNAIVENVGAGLLVRLTDPLPASIANAAPGGFRRDPAHVAPEVRTAGQLTPAADVYALGSTLIELLGSEPASPEFDELLRRCLDPLADSRPPINEVVHEIDRLTSNTVAARRGALRPLPASGARPRAPRLVGPNPGLLVPVADASPPALRKVATPGAFNGIDPGFFFSDAEPPIGPSATPSLTDLPADSLTDSPAVERVDERPDEPTAATPPTRRRRRAMVLLAVSAIAVAGAAVVVTRSDPHMPPTGSGLPVVERPTAAVETFVDRGATVTVRQFALVAGPRRYAQLKVAVTVTNTGPHELSVPRGPNGRLVAILGVMGGLDSYIPPAGTEIEPGELAIDPDSLGITTSRRATGVTAVPANPDGMVESFRSTTSTSATNTASRDGSTAPDTMESFPTAFPTRIVPSGGSTGDEPGTAAVFFVPNHSEILGVAVLGRGGAVLAFQSAADWPTLTSANAF